ncbi:MAG: hypothetical protein AAFZ17_09540 [Cyanobacteria bacterium J06650_10]
MKKFFLSRFNFSLVLSLPIIGLLPLQTMAQRVEGRTEGFDHSNFLLTGANCVVSGDNSNYSRIFDRTESVPIGRQVYTSQFAVEASEYSSLNCGVDPQEFGTLDLQIGVNDNKISRDSRMTVNIYQGSNLAYRYDNVRGGTLINVLLELDGAAVSGGQSNFSVEMSNCQGSGPCRLEFTKAQLLPSDGFATSGPAVYPTSSPSTTAPSNSAPVDSAPVNTVPESNSSGQDNSSRQDSSPGSGGGSGIGERIIDRTVDRVLDSIF